MAGDLAGVDLQDGACISHEKESYETEIWCWSFLADSVKKI